jgi:hypothetical protein
MHISILFISDILVKHFKVVTGKCPTATGRNERALETWPLNDPPNYDVVLNSISPGTARNERAFETWPLVTHTNAGRAEKKEGSETLPSSGFISLRVGCGLVHSAHSAAHSAGHSGRHL